MSEGVPPLESFAGQHVLLLQGPVGSFFDLLARDLMRVGARVRKINFNGGDRYFYRQPGSVDYTGTLEEWPGFLENFLRKEGIDCVILYGDCRPVHDVAFSICERLGTEIYTFEEGYIRPHYVTFEKGRVNGGSRLPRDPAFYRNLPAPEARAEPVSKRTYLRMAYAGGLYHLMAWRYGRHFPHARELHHRGLGLEEAGPQFLSIMRKGFHALWDLPARVRVLWRERGRYFLVPLQVPLDSQIHRYSRYGDRERRSGDIGRFIEEVMRSFARHAPSEALLVFEHHPMDRGYNHYGRLIRGLARELGIRGRVLYFIKNVRLPPLIDNSRGVIVINSTVGLQAIQHGRPVIALGEAIYNMEGLTAQCGLDAFWREAGAHAPDPDLVARFTDYLVRHCLILGSFFRRREDSPLDCGLNWPLENPERFGRDSSTRKVRALKRQGGEDGRGFRAAGMWEKSCGPGPDGKVRTLAGE
jgi:capsular polysaccharide export protein